MSRAIPFACSAAVALASVAALAQPTEPREQPAEQRASMHFQRATDLYASDDFEFALSEFQAAYDALPHPSVLRNIASSLERLHRYPEAMHTLERYLSEATGPALRAERAEIETHLARLRNLVGRIQIDLQDPGFAITVDGRAVGTSPLTEPIEASIGRREVTAVKDGWEPATEIAVVESGQTASLVLRPIARMARLSVDSSARHAMVSVDGSPALAAPWENAVMPGPHEVRVTAPGRRTARLHVELDPGAERSMVVQLEAGGPQGMISVEITPAEGTRATVDGLPIDPGRASARTVEQGLHQVVAEGPGRASYVANVRVRANRVTRVRVHLDEDRFWVSPLWGTIAAGGAALALGSAIWNGANASWAARRYRDPSTQTDDLQGYYDQRTSFARAADVSILTTVIVGAGAALLYYWSLQKPASRGRTTYDAIE